MYLCMYIFTSITLVVYAALVKKRTEWHHLSRIDKNCITFTHKSVRF